MADAIAFLISARASLLELANEPSSDPRVERVLALVSAKAVEALSALDDLSVAKWVECGRIESLGYSPVRLPIEHARPDGQAQRELSLIREHCWAHPGLGPSPISNDTDNCDR
jgi:hypothetical protein